MRTYVHNRETKICKLDKVGNSKLKITSGYHLQFQLKSNFINLYNILFY